MPLREALSGTLAGKERLPTARNQDDRIVLGNVWLVILDSLRTNPEKAQYGEHGGGKQATIFHESIHAGIDPRST
jgi:hypothetical protein